LKVIVVVVVVDVGVIEH